MTDPTTQTIPETNIPHDDAPPADPGMTIAQWEAHKHSLISIVEEKLAAIPHEIVAEVKVAFAALKAHL
ncbi:MAG: hypothetical protein KGL20_05210 [Rhodospirillales bacterium]|nr:hypothetical protein [Rhodospirillales bacterium]